ncbi:MAG: DUF3429 domain-containing protein [Gammaproteobacteria bacterium]|nr:DUF3429 domain-containing protein [Gammaproteobacteria bacterium]
MQAVGDIKRHVLWLGYLGVTPLLLASAFVIADNHKLLAIDFVKAYAAVILTFVGAIHWGRAMHSGDGTLLTMSVLPSLFASGCLLLPPLMAIPLLAAGFIVVMIFDYRQYLAISWFQKMRIQLTSMVVFLLLLNTLFISGQGN